MPCSPSCLKPIAGSGTMVTQSDSNYKEVITTSTIRVEGENPSMAIRLEYDDDQTGDLIVNLVPELRKRIKIAAEQSGLSVQEYVSLILKQTVPPIDFAERRSGRLNRAAVEKLLQTREAIQ